VQEVSRAGEELPNLRDVFGTDAALLLGGGRGRRHRLKHVTGERLTRRQIPGLPDPMSGLVLGDRNNIDRAAAGVGAPSSATGASASAAPSRC